MHEDDQLRLIQILFLVNCALKRKSSEQIDEIIKHKESRRRIVIQNHE